MDTVKSRQNSAGEGAAPSLFQSTTREHIERTANTSGICEVKKVFELRLREGKRTIIESPLIRITPDPQGFVLVEAFAAGVWSPIMTTPHYFDLQCKEG